MEANRVPKRRRLDEVPECLIGNDDDLSTLSFSSSTAYSQQTALGTHQQSSLSSQWLHDTSMNPSTNASQAASLTDSNFSWRHQVDAQWNLNIPSLSGMPSDLISGSSYQFNVPNIWHPSNNLVPVSSTSASSAGFQAPNQGAALGFPGPLEPAQKHHLTLNSPLCSLVSHPTFDGVLDPQQWEDLFGLHTQVQPNLFPGTVAQSMNHISPLPAEGDSTSQQQAVEQPQAILQQLAVVVQQLEEAEMPEPVTEPEEKAETVCFGMVPAILGRWNWTVATQALSSPTPVQLESSIKFVAKDYPDTSGQISSEHAQMIQGLLDDKTLNLYLSCMTDQPQNLGGQKPSRAGVQCVIEITVYGPLEIFDEIGTWFEEYHVYLQDPRECHLDVAYCNPHRLSSDPASSPMLSEVVSQSSRALHLENITPQNDLLDVLSSPNDLEETPQPRIIKGELRRHQKQALTFMLRREQGWAFHDQDVWEVINSDQGQIFLNRISNAHQTEEPPQCYGGIIADPMGLGKTLTMIALAATDLDTNSILMETGPDDREHLAVPATLIVVPPPLMGTWEQQLSEHVIEGGFQCRRHHRESRLTSSNQLHGVNVVLTTYHTVSADWNVGNGVDNSILFSVRWRRIILDEAHLIRNSAAKMSQAICALRSKSRWAVTGTPIQNRLGDLASLFKFIRAHPYTDTRCFDTDISRLWKSGQDEEAVKRLKRLSACLLLRRAKGTISLPARRDLQCPVDFSREERALYDTMRHKAIVSIEEALAGDFERSRSGVYVNVLQQIESLRLFCNLGLHYHSRHGQVPQAIQDVNDWTRIAQATFNAQRQMEPIVCSQCSSILEITETLFGDPAPHHQTPQFANCLTFVCGDCTQKIVQAGRIVRCIHKPSCPLAPVSTDGNALESSLDDFQSQIETASLGLPSKVAALVTDIKSMPRHEKCIVFSTWRLTLDIVEAGLEQSCIRCVRFDGNVPQKERQNIVDKFKTDPSTRVMLLTLSCGAAGLTLTVATRAYLMEPHWNPTLEEQALARIHRIGQTREVTTVRFYVRESFEQQVMAVQESKKHLAGVLLSAHDGGQADESLGRLQTLRSLI